MVSGVIKFEMLKVGATQIITFDINKALDFSGYTAAYLQYTIARFNSIIRKSEVKKPELNSENLKEEKEYGLVLKMSKFPETVKKAAEKYDPSEITKYLFELAQLANEYYHSVQILNSEEETMKARLVLISSVNQVLENGLRLLGIEVLEEM